MVMAFVMYSSLVSLDRLIYTHAEEQSVSPLGPFGDMISLTLFNITMQYYLHRTKRDNRRSRGSVVEHVAQ